MSYTLILNSSNVIGNNNTSYQYTFANTFQVHEGAQICVSQVVIPYSFYNINITYYNNATFQYLWYYGNGLSINYTVIIPSGFYTTSDLNNYLELYMISKINILLMLQQVKIFII